MKYREFKLKDTITQGEYRIFRTKLQEMKPDVWESIDKLPLEMLFDALTVSAIHGGWVEDIVEDNEYEEETTWEWNQEYLDDLPADPESPTIGWGSAVFTRWMDIRGIDPN